MEQGHDGVEEAFNCCKRRTERGSDGERERYVEGEREGRREGGREGGRE